MGRPPIHGVAMTPTEMQRRWRAKRKTAIAAAGEDALLKRLKASRKLRVQSTQPAAERGLDAYFTGPEAVVCVAVLERDYLPRVILDPCAGQACRAVESLIT